MVNGHLDRIKIFPAAPTMAAPNQIKALIHKVSKYAVSMALSRNVRLAHIHNIDAGGLARWALHFATNSDNNNNASSVITNTTATFTWTSYCRESTSKS